jgi:hypothetical protein
MYNIKFTILTHQKKIVVHDDDLWDVNLVGMSKHPLIPYIVLA